MLNLSELMMQHPETESFDELIKLVKDNKQNAIHFRIDVKPPFPDTPENWEDRLEAAFT